MREGINAEKDHVFNCRGGRAEPADRKKGVKFAKMGRGGGGYNYIGSKIQIFYIMIRFQPLSSRAIKVTWKG